MARSLPFACLVFAGWSALTPLALSQSSCAERALVETLPSGLQGPKLSTPDGAPVLGGPFSLQILGGPPLGVGVLRVSTSQAPTFVPQLGGTVYPSLPALELPFALDAAGSSRLFLESPGLVSAMLCGREVFAQAVMRDPASQQLSATDALRLRAGDSLGEWFHGPVFPTGDRPEALASGDLNGDGHPDLITVSPLDQVDVLLGLGEGDFGAFTSYPTGVDPVDAICVDLDGDGALDVVTADEGGDTLSVLLGNGDGSLAPAVSYPCGSEPLTVTAGDLNGDGAPDLVCGTDEFGNNVRVFLGNGDGTVTAGAVLSLPVDPDRGILIDLDGDGNLDLVMSGIHDAHVLLGNGDGTFGAATAWAPGFFFNSTQDLAVADLDGDGALDLVFAIRSFGGLSVRLGNGDGTFQGFTVFAGPNTEGHMAVGDVDADGFVDVVTTTTLDEVAVWLGVGDGTPAPAVTYRSRTRPTGLILLDADGDGDLDVALSDELADDVQVLMGRGDGTLATGGYYPVNSLPGSLAIGDLNGDAVPDLAVSMASSYATELSLLMGAGDGSFGPASQLSGFYFSREVEAVDISGDGFNDLVTLSVQGLLVHLGNGDGTFQPLANYPTGNTPTGFGLGDIDRNGLLDAAVVSQVAGKCDILLGNGDGGFTKTASVATGSSPGAVALADLDEDGWLDLAVGDSQGFSVLLADGLGGFGAPSTYLVTPFAARRFIEAVDLDEDSHQDLLLISASFPAVTVFYGSGDGTLTQGAIPAPLGGAYELGVGDVNGDGLLDIVTANDSGPGTATVLPGLGNRDFGAPVAFNTGNRSQGLALGDLDGDGMLDLALTNLNSDDVTVLINQVGEPLEQ